MIFWKLRRLEELLLTPEQVIEMLQYIKQESNRSMEKFLKLLKKHLGETFRVLNIVYVSELHIPVYISFLNDVLTTEETFRLLIALNQDKPLDTVMIFDKLLDLSVAINWINNLNGLLRRPEYTLPLIGGFVLSYPSFVKKSGIDSGSLRALLFQSLFHWNQLDQKGLKHHFSHFESWIDIHSNTSVVLDLLKAILDLNDVDLVDSLVALVKSWMQSSQCTSKIFQRLVMVIEENHLLGDFVMIGLLDSMREKGWYDDQQMVERINQWVNDERTEMKRFVLRQVLFWVKSGTIDESFAKELMNNAKKDEDAIVRGEIIHVIFNLYQENFLSLTEILESISLWVNDPHPLIKTMLFTGLLSINKNEYEIIQLLNSVKSSWLELLSHPSGEESLLSACLTVIKLYYDHGLISDIEVRKLVLPYLESPYWRHRFQAAQLLSYLIHRGVFEPSEIKMIFRKEKKDLVLDVVRKSLEVY